VDQFATLANGIGSLLGSGGQGGGSGLLGLLNWSDARLKEDIAMVGALFDGTPIYRYRYKGAPAYHIGLMAQDIERINPDAVAEIGAYKAVNYHMATEAAKQLHKGA
jgi:hypothetical protein